MPGAGRLGDKARIQSDAHGCPGCPHPGLGPAIAGSPTVFINARPALRVDDVGIHAACCGTNMWSARQGSSTVFINGKAAFRRDDPSQHCGGSGKLIEGSDDVIIGGAASAGSVANGAKDNSGARQSSTAADPPRAGRGAATGAQVDGGESSAQQQSTVAGTQLTRSSARWSIEDAEGTALKGISATFTGSIGVKDFDGSRGRQLGLPIDDSYELALNGKIKVIGKLQDSVGKPIANAQLRVERAWGPDVEITSDAQGHFETDGFLHNEPIALIVVFTRHVLQGTLEDSDGKPVANARVSVGRDSDELVALTTDSQGHFKVDGLAPNEPIALTVDATSMTAQARIVDEAGASIVGRRARLCGDGGCEVVVCSDGAGMVRLDGLMPGETYQVDLELSTEDGKGTD